MTVFNAVGLFAENSGNHRGDYKYLWAFLSHIRKSRGYVPIMAFQNISLEILENSAAGWFSDQI